MTSFIIVQDTVCFAKRFHNYVNDTIESTDPVQNQNFGYRTKILNFDIVSLHRCH